jgi:hypothetical protein
VCILVSTTALAVDNNFIGKDSTLYKILSYSDIVINVVFTIELILKVSLSLTHTHTCPQACAICTHAHT